MSSNPEGEPIDYCREMNEGEKRDGELVVPGADPPVAFCAAKEVFDAMATAVIPAMEGHERAPSSFWWDANSSTLATQASAEGVGIKTFVSDRAETAQTGQQRFDRIEIVPLAGRNTKCHGQIPARVRKVGLRGAQFLPVVKHHIVELDWGAWDTTQDEPPEIPESGEPEDYILRRPHSPAVAAAMPDLWELVASEDQTADVYYLPGTRVTALSPQAKHWFERNHGEYVSIKIRS
ncbi:MAG TPA: hypothetical protein VHE61_12725 [Opitutaceae bacterium]|nr:hypothetical protein [Opitutaceae bacterium]